MLDFLFPLSQYVAIYFSAQVQVQQEQKMRKYLCSFKETCTFTSQQWELGVSNVKKYNAHIIRQNIAIWALFTHLTNSGWFQNPNAYL